MKVDFVQKTPQEIFDHIQSLLQGRKLGSLVNIQMDASTLYITIKKLGTSRLEFSMEEIELENQLPCTRICLQHKKIPLTHRAMEKELLGKFTQVLEQSGGKIIEAYRI